MAKLTWIGRLNYFILDNELHPPIQPTHCLEPSVKGLPPKSPVYAVINKLNKKKSQPTSPTSENAEQQPLQPFQLPVDEKIQIQPQPVR